MVRLACFLGDERNHDLKSDGSIGGIKILHTDTSAGNSNSSDYSDNCIIVITIMMMRRRIVVVLLPIMMMIIMIIR